MWLLSESSWADSAAQILYIRLTYQMNKEQPLYLLFLPVTPQYSPMTSSQLNENSNQLSKRKMKYQHPPKARQFYLGQPYIGRADTQPRQIPQSKCLNNFTGYNFPGICHWDLHQVNAHMAGALW